MSEEEWGHFIFIDYEIKNKISKTEKSNKEYLYKKIYYNFYKEVNKEDNKEDIIYEKINDKSTNIIIIGSIIFYICEIVVYFCNSCKCIASKISFT